MLSGNVFLNVLSVYQSQNILRSVEFAGSPASVFNPAESGWLASGV